ncbi:MAG: hypothetical protein A2722_01690 [Candidatus Doudnabacteria bacterium RIFCSPHIGHO2_01_FULL_50_11]|uniref:Uncharacterized protein n=1 Tax=Candidatus Doudnabacteria bacterium RIFCSPHIGHO2_01_FULL_50_11 TaxID=1817828 RepID=A0A1F5PEC0_9BACT|nr:MAG: hypothetical protein A2722_01690 [Candidatus Doudnabacteria bacterium RIFCSPHIGHO2_01_FULL_50_11]HLC44320.1 hypothetical protein [Patescibacteria group bacterium]
MTKREELLAEEIARIQALSREDKKIDTAALVSDALLRHRASTGTAKGVWRAYLVSLLFPPFGLYYTIRFFFEDSEDARQAAWVCLTLTAVSGFFTLWLLNAAFSSSTVKQIENISPQQIRDLGQ